MKFLTIQFLFASLLLAGCQGPSILTSTSGVPACGVRQGVPAEVAGSVSVIDLYLNKTEGGPSFYYLSKSDSISILFKKAQCSAEGFGYMEASWTPSGIKQVPDIPMAGIVGVGKGNGGAILLLGDDASGSPGSCICQWDGEQLTALGRIMAGQNSYVREVGVLQDEQGSIAVFGIYSGTLRIADRGGVGFDYPSIEPSEDAGRIVANEGVFLAVLDAHGRALSHGRPIVADPTKGHVLGSLVGRRFANSTALIFTVTGADLSVFVLPPSGIVSYNHTNAVVVVVGYDGFAVVSRELYGARLALPIVTDHEFLLSVVPSEEKTRWGTEFTHGKGVGLLNLRPNLDLRWEKWFPAESVGQLVLTPLNEDRALLAFSAGSNLIKLDATDGSIISEKSVALPVRLDAWRSMWFSVYVSETQPRYRLAFFED